jgi:hypothetical protein
MIRWFIRFYAYCLLLAVVLIGIAAILDVFVKGARAL